jgi:hypothetical protein
MSSGVPGSDPLTRATAWILGAIDQFEIAGHQGEEQIGLVKPFSELVLCCHLMRTNLGATPFTETVFRWAWSQAEGCAVFRRILAARPDLYQLGLPVYCFRAAGFDVDRTLPVLAAVSRTRAFLRYESEQWVRVAAAYAYDRLGLRPMSRADFEGTWLLHRPEPWLINTASIYALTHEVFYLTDFGRRIDLCDQQTRAYVNCWGPVWSDYFVERRDFDVLGELLIIADCLGLDWTDRFRQQLLAAQLDDGAFPGPKRAGQQLSSPSDQPARTAFLGCYHTTLVAMIYLSMTAGSTAKARPMTAGVV